MGAWGGVWGVVYGFMGAWREGGLWVLGGCMGA